MGKTLTPTYAVEFFDVRANGQLVGWTPMGWPTRQAGRPTNANLGAFIVGYEQSTMPGGCNAHLGPTVIGRARIVRNVGERVEMATYDRAKR